MRSSTKKRVLHIVLWILNLLFALVILFPILYCFNVSNMTKTELYAYPPKFFAAAFSLENYKVALELAPFFRFILNSLLVSSICTAAQVLTGALAGYCFAMFDFKGKNLIFSIMLATMMIPGQAILIANYLTVSQWGINNTYAALVLPYLASAFAVFNMRQAFLSLPRELFEAAMVDGCTRFKYFCRIGLPLVKPAVGALGIYVFLDIWNYYMWPLIVVNTVDMRTVQIGLGMLQGSESTNFGPVMAGAMMILLPSIIVFVIGQKQLVEGLTSGAVKG